MKKCKQNIKAKMELFAASFAHSWTKPPPLLKSTHPNAKTKTNYTHQLIIPVFLLSILMCHLCCSTN